MNTVAITGAAGTVGRALTGRLRDRHTIVPIDRPDVDILAQPQRLTAALQGADVVIHLAFDPGGDDTSPPEHWQSPGRNSVNDALFGAVLDGALAAGAALFLHASSVHVEDTMAWPRRSTEPLRAVPGRFRTVTPSSYGRSKRAQEARLQSVAHRFAHGAVSLRLGAVTPDGAPMAHHDDPAVLDHERRVWLAHDDLGELVSRIIDARTAPGYDVVYAVSAADRFHDVANRYGWAPDQSTATGSGRTQPSSIAGVQPPTSSMVTDINPPA